MPGIVKVDTWLDSSGSVIKRPINYYRHRWEDQTVIASNTYVYVTGSQFTYTPIQPNTLLKITGEVHASPYNSADVNYAGMTWAIFINGVEYGKQVNAHEMYLTTGNDLYLARRLKTVFYTVPPTITTLTINVWAKTHVATTNGRVNQSNQWESYIHVWEITQ